MLTIKRTQEMVQAEVMRARAKHVQANARHDVSGWTAAIKKQVADLESKNPKDRLAVRKELLQIAAAATLAVVHLDPEGDDRET